MQETERAARQPLGIAFDGDLSSRIDAVLAVAVLNGLCAKGEARRISLTVSRPSLPAARLADVLAEFYPTQPEGFGFSTIGMPAGEPASGDAPALAAMLSRKAADGTALYATNIGRAVDTAESNVLIRNVLVAQEDANAAIVLAGAATGLARLLDLNGSRPQLAAKVKHLVVAAGAYPSGPADPAILADVAAARRLFSQWPTPLIAVGSEVGEALAYPTSNLDRDLAWSPAHPVAAACRSRDPLPRTVPTAALAAMLHAVHPEAAFFKLSEPGTISVLDDGRTRFTAGKGEHRYLIVDLAQRARVAEQFAALVSATPAPRPVRRAPPMQPPAPPELAAPSKAPDVKAP